MADKYCVVFEPRCQVNADDVTYDGDHLTNETCVECKLTRETISHSTSRYINLLSISLLLTIFTRN